MLSVRTTSESGKRSSTVPHDRAGLQLPTRLRTHLKAAEIGIRAPKLVRLSIEVLLPGADDCVTAVVEATPWPAHGHPRHEDYEPAHIEVESVSVDGSPITLPESVTLQIEELVAVYLDRQSGTFELEEVLRGDDL